MSAQSLKKIFTGISILLMGFMLTACSSENINEEHQRITNELAARGFTNLSWEVDGSSFALINAQMGECRVQIKRYTNTGNYELVRQEVVGIEGIQFPDPTVVLVKHEYPELAPCFSSGEGSDTAPTAK